MSLFSQALFAQSGGGGQIATDIKASPVGSIAVREVSIWLLGAGNPLFGLKRTTAELLQLDPRNFQGEEGDGPSFSTMATVWSNSPSLASASLRLATITGAGSGVIWSFPFGLIVNSLNSLAVTTNSSAISQISSEIEE
jgi:hypothetical protein